MKPMTEAQQEEVRAIMLSLTSWSDNWQRVSRDGLVVSCRFCTAYVDYGTGDADIEHGEKCIYDRAKRLLAELEEE